MSGYLDERQFSDELQLRRGFLASLRDHPSTPEIDDRIRDFESEIAALRGEDIGTTMMTDMNDQYGTYASSSSMSTPMSSDPGESASHRLNVPSRKRSIGSSHLDVDPVDRSKRATPTTTPAPTKPASPSAMSFGSASSEDGKLSSPRSVIDLTDEDKVWLQREGERFNSRNPYERMALANNWGYILNDADSLSSTPMTLARRPHPPNGQSSYTGQNNGTHLSGYRARTPNHNQPTPQLAAWQSNGPQLQGSYGSLPGPSSQYWMPGTYVDSDSDGEQHAPGPLSTANSHVPLLNSSSPGSQFNPSGTSHQQQQISSSHGLHRQAPVLQQTGSIAFGANRQLPPLPALPVQTYAPMDFRFPINTPLPTNQMPPLGYSGICGMYAPMAPDRPDMLDSGLYLPQPQGPSLSELTARTSGIDYGSGLDAQGNPLNPRLTNFLHGDSPYDSEREKKEIVDLLSNIQTDVHVLKEDVGTPDGMKYPLYDHQKLGLKWMTQMEKGTNRGGILADDMGLGKTITALALIVTRQSETAFKTNLIIGPVALIRQWELEIQNKLNLSHKLGILLLHQKRKIPFSEIKKYDVVLTTYGSIAAEWKQYEKHIEQRQASALYSEEADAELAKKCPLLHPKSKFHRIILDEAQCIKNKDTQGAKGVHKIEATYRWCLTGTPIMNNVTELYSLFRFLRIKPYSDFKLFQRAFKSLGPRTTGTNNNRSQAMKQLRAVLQATMLRRMKNSVINGKPILTLPPKNEYSELVQFSEEELQFYKDLENRSQVVLNRYLRAGTVGKNYSNILVLLLRLRQACCHPHLTEFETVSSPAADDESLLALAKEMDEAVVTRVREIEAFECPICYDAVDDPLLLLPCGHDVCSECFSSLQGSEARTNIREGNGQDPAGICCPVCRGTSKKSIKYSVFVKAHVPEKLGAGEEALPDISDWDDSSDDDDNEADDESAGSLADFVVDDDEDELDDDAKLDAELSAAIKIKKEEGSKSTMKAPKKKGKSKEDNKPVDKGKSKDEPVEPSQLRNLRDEAAKNMAARRRYMKYLHDNWEDSAKVTKVLELLVEIQKTNEKTIIFSQWTSLLDLIECQVKSKLNIEHCRYAGNMSRSQRDEAVADFVGNPKNRVMLVSLRAGNAGLNLTVASRIIICDPFWNPYIEMQAVDRAHRIGQQREVQVHRILVKETVEDRILNLQQQKRELVDSALNEGRDKNAARLNNDQLRYLFGVGNLPPAHG